MLCKPSWPKWYICGIPAGGFYTNVFGVRNNMCLRRGQSDATYDTQPVSDMTGTRREVEVLPPFGAPLESRGDFGGENEMNN